MIQRFKNSEEMTALNPFHIVRTSSLYLMQVDIVFDYGSFSMSSAYTSNELKKSIFASYIKNAMVSLSQTDTNVYYIRLQ